MHWFVSLDVHNQILILLWEIGGAADTQGQTKQVDFVLSRASLNINFLTVLIRYSHSQVQYATGNTYQDRLARFRLASGERATSLNLGPIDLDGPNYRGATFRDLVFNSRFHLSQSEEDLCALIEYTRGREQKTVRTPEMAQIIMGIEDPAVIRSNGHQEPDWMHQQIFSHFYTRGSGELSAKDRDAEKDKSKISMLFAAAATAAAVTIATNALIQKLSSVLSLTPDTCNYTFLCFFSSLLRKYSMLGHPKQVSSLSRRFGS